jgi:hypothetical protein
MMKVRVSLSVLNVTMLSLTTLTVANITLTIDPERGHFVFEGLTLSWLSTKLRSTTTKEENMEIFIAAVSGVVVTGILFVAVICAFIDGLINIDSPKFSRYDEWKMNRINKKHNKSKGR